MLGLGWIGLILYSVYLQRAIGAIAQLKPLPSAHYEDAQGENFPRVTVIIPAYNEAENIEACVLSVLESTHLGADRLAIWVVDDQSTDATPKLLQNLAERSLDPRLQIWAGQPRPRDAQWRGKNWACVQAADRTTSEFILFIDADVRLQPGRSRGRCRLPKPNRWIC